MGLRACESVPVDRGPGGMLSQQRESMAPAIRNPKSEIPRLQPEACSLKNLVRQGPKPRPPRRAANSAGPGFDML